MNTVAVVGSISRKAGGLQQSVRRLHQSLNELSNVKVSVVSFLDEYSTQDLPGWQPLPVNLSRVIGPHAFGFAPNVLPELLRADADLIHSHGIWQYPSVAVSRWHRKTGRPYLVSPHGMLDSWAIRNSAWKKRFALSLYERRHLEGAACLRALCQSEANAIRQIGLTNPICIIPNAIDIPSRASRPVGGKVLLDGNFEHGRKVLLFLGRIHPKKGLANLIRAWSAVQASEWILAIAGWDQDGHETELKRLCADVGVPFSDSNPFARSTGLSASVYFMGPQFGDSKIECYTNCDAFILPSFSEGLPMAVLEAWSYGKPVIMTPECNLPEGFADSAAIAIDANTESITRSLETLFQAGISDLQSIGLRGRQLVAARFAWPKVAQEMKSVYGWVLEGGKKPLCVTTLS